MLRLCNLYDCGEEDYLKANVAGYDCYPVAPDMQKQIKDYCLALLEMKRMVFVPHLLCARNCKAH